MQKDQNRRGNTYGGEALSWLFLCNPCSARGAEEAECGVERRLHVPGPNSVLRAARDRTGPQVRSEDIQSWDSW